MPEKSISAPLSSVVSPPNTPMYRSRKKLHMESHYFNTSRISKTHEPRRSPIGKAKAVETVFPTTKYKMNSNSWFQHAFGSGTDDGKTQASSAAYNGKTFSGRPKHYASASGESIPTNLKGFSELYGVGDDSDDVFVPGGTIDFTRLIMDTLGPISIRSDKEDGHSSRYSTAASSVSTRSKKRELPKDFDMKEYKERKQARARTEESWEFGRALAKKHVHSLWRQTPAGKKWDAEHKSVEAEKGVRLGTMSGEKQLYDQKGNKSFMFLQVDVVMPAEDMSPSPISAM